MPPSAAPEWLRVGWSFDMTATSAPASYASIAARIPAQPAPTTRTSWDASTRAEASGTAWTAAWSCGGRLDDPQGAVGAVDALRAFDLAETRPGEPPAVEHRADPASLRHERPGTHLAVHVGRRLREVDDRVLGLEVALVLPSHLRQPRVAGFQLREHLLQQPDGRGLEVRDQRLLGVVGTDRDRLLRQDVARVEGRVHEVIGHPDL